MCNSVAFDIFAVVSPSPRSNFKTPSSPQKDHREPLQSISLPATSPRPLHTYFPSGDLPFLDISYKWNHITGGLFNVVFSAGVIGHVTEYVWGGILWAQFSISEPPSPECHQMLHWCTPASKLLPPGVPLPTSPNSGMAQVWESFITSRTSHKISRK